jgi:hypothetical protein
MRCELGLTSKLPVSRSDPIEFIAHYQYKESRRLLFIGSYISGLSCMHKSKEFDDPADCFTVRKMFEGCRRDSPNMPDTRKPVTLCMLKKVL